MNLNKTDKAATLQAILDDIPQVAYLEKFRELVQTVWEASAPPEVKALVKQGLTQHLHQQFWSFRAGSVATYGLIKLSGGDRDLFQAKKDALGDLWDLQSDKITTVKQQLQPIIDSCRTLKQLRERLPEFEKYFPKERGTSTANLPVANVVADLQALGWPKEGK